MVRHPDVVRIKKGQKFAPRVTQPVIARNATLGIFLPDVAHPFSPTGAMSLDHACCFIRRPVINDNNLHLYAFLR
jgi:hypothetical protein